MNPKSSPEGRESGKPDAPRDEEGPDAQEPGSNAVEHEPDPKAQPLPDGQHKYIRKSPYTAGND